MARQVFTADEIQDSWVRAREELRDIVPKFWHDELPKYVYPLARIGGTLILAVVPKGLVNGLAAKRKPDFLLAFQRVLGHDAPASVEFVAVDDLHDKITPSFNRLIRHRLEERARDRAEMSAAMNARGGCGKCCRPNHLCGCEVPDHASG